MKMNTKKRFKKKQLLYSLFLSLFFISAICVAATYNLLDRGDLAIYDGHFRLKGPRPPSGKVMLVLMDQQSARELKRKKGSWSRKNLATAIENLCNAGSEIIGIDLVLFAPGHDQKEDLLLSEAIEECGSVVLAKFVASEDRGEVNPLPIFQDAMIGDGFINTTTDIDDVLRRIPLLSIKPTDSGISLSPGFSLELARTFLNIDFTFDFSEKDHFTVGKSGEQRIKLPYPDLMINYLGGEDVFERLKYADAVKNRFPADLVKGKIVIIGSSLATDRDFYSTPFPGRKDENSSYRNKFADLLVAKDIKTAGVACHAHAVETILSQRFFHEVPSSYILALTFIAGCLGLLFYMQRPGFLFASLILLFQISLLFGISHILFSRYLIWLRISAPVLVLLLQFIGGTSVQKVFSRIKAKFITNLFGKYVSPDVVNDLIEGEEAVDLKGRSKEVTVLFSDLRSFTSISEKLNPQETGQLLNTYFDAMISVVFEHKGTLDKLIGDAIMAFFGAPARLEDHEIKAAETALQMVDALKRLNEKGGVKGLEQLRVGIGLNTGQVVVGNLGSSQFMDYTVIGDTVNLGSRIEGLNKVYGTSIIITQSTADNLDSRFVLRELDLVMVKGKKNAVKIYELMGFAADIDPLRLELADLFESCLASYRKMDWKGAEAYLGKARSIFPEDGPSRLYMERIRRYRNSPPADDWDGVTVFTTK